MNRSPNKAVDTQTSHSNPRGKASPHQLYCVVSLVVGDERFQALLSLYQKSLRAEPHSDSFTNLTFEP